MPEEGAAPSSGTSIPRASAFGIRDSAFDPERLGEGRFPPNAQWRMPNAGAIDSNAQCRMPNAPPRTPEAAPHKPVASPHKPASRSDVAIWPFDHLTISPPPPSPRVIRVVTRFDARVGPIGACVFVACARVFRLCAKVFRPCARVLPAHGKVFPAHGMVFRPCARVFAAHGMVFPAHGGVFLAHDAVFLAHGTVLADHARAARARATNKSATHP